MLFNFLSRAHLLGAVLLAMTALITPDVSSASAPDSRQQPEPVEPLAAVESFLAARDAGDAWGAAIWCAKMLELQAIDGQWFVEPLSVSYWLIELNRTYLVDTLRPPAADGDKVTWTERLTPRGERFPDTVPPVMTLDVHAVVRDGKIASLSAPYPPFSLRDTGTLGTPGRREQYERATVPPAAMFLGSAGVLALTAVVVALGGARLSAAQRRRPRPGAVGYPPPGFGWIDAKRRTAGRALKES